MKKPQAILKSRTASPEVPEYRDLASIVEDIPPQRPQVLFITEYATVLVFRLQTLTRPVLTEKIICNVDMHRLG